MDEETRYWIGFSVFPGIGPVRFKLLLGYFGTAKQAWKAPAAELHAVHLPERIISEFCTFRNTFSIDTYISTLQKNHIGVLTLNHSKYPVRLREISDAPFVLYVRGEKTRMPIDFTKTIGVVGTRKVTSYGTQVTRRLTEQLVAYGFTIVSGLAYGVDTIAHQSAIDAGGNTIAVLGCGIDIIAPASNIQLYRTIVSGHGCVVSEMPLGHRPGKGLFPARNRIISGLSSGVLVTEGATDSGALITARNAAEQGRDVFAVPGPITSAYSKAPALLLKQGAVLVEDVEDIINALGLDDGSRHVQSVGDERLKNLLPAEQLVVTVLARQTQSVDEIVRASGLTISEVSSTITILEIKGIIRDVGEKTYTLT